MTAAHRYGVCNFEKRGAFAMSKKNWDRVPIDAQSIDAPLSRAAVFLVVTVASELTALTKVCPPRRLSVMKMLTSWEAAMSSFRSIYTISARGRRFQLLSRRRSLVERK